ncbi:MAG: hypothetical protein ACTS27_08620 [Phycisphaerales bacterium]
MPSNTRRIRAAAALLALSAPLSFAHATPSVVLLDDSLDARRAELVAITAGDSGRRASIVYLDRNGVRREASPYAGPDSAVAVLPPLEPRWLPAQTPRFTPSSDGLTGVLVLADGQRFPGRYADSSAPGDAVAWSHPRFGLIVTPIERIAHIHPTDDVTNVAGDERFNDRLSLTNGDTLEGFILSLADPVEIETDAGVIEVPRARVQRVDLATDAIEPEGLTLWLDDGSVAALSDAALVDDETLLLTLKDTGGQARYALTSISAVALDASRIVPLASLRVLAEEPLGERELLDGARVEPQPTPAPLGAADVFLPEPVAVEYELPQGASRFAAVAELPRDAFPFGDCEFVVSIDGREVLRERLNPARAAVEFSVDASGSVLRLALEPGEYGPVNDRAVLRRAIVLLSE